MHYGFAMANNGAKDYLTLSGTVLDSKFFGDTLGVSAFVSAESDLYTGVIGSDGSFSIAIPLQDFVTQDTNGFFHATITDTTGAIVYGGSTKNLLVADCTTDMPAVTKGTVGGDIVSAVSYQSTVDGLVYYVGYAWDGLMPTIPPTPITRFLPRPFAILKAFIMATNGTKQPIRKIILPGFQMITGPALMRSFNTRLAMA